MYTLFIFAEVFDLIFITCFAPKQIPSMSNGDKTMSACTSDAVIRAAAEAPRHAPLAALLYPLR